MYHTETPTDKTIREWYMNSSRVAACALRNEQAVRTYGPGRPVHFAVISKCVTAVKVSNFSGHYLRNRSTLDIGVLGFFGIV